MIQRTHTRVERKGKQMTPVKEPKIKAGQIRKCYNGHEYKVIKLSNDFEEVRKYDLIGMCDAYSTEEKLINTGLDPEDVLYCAVVNNDEHENELYNRFFVFLVSRDSEILGE